MADEGVDEVDLIRARLAELYPSLDTTAFGLTGRILRLAQRITAERAEYLSAFDMTCGDYDVMATIRRTDVGQGVNPRLLLGSVLITSGGLTKRLDRLEGAGLVERRPDPDDRRGTLIRLTRKGKTRIDRVLPSLLEMEGQTALTALRGRELDEAGALLRHLVMSPAHDQQEGPTS